MQQVHEHARRPRARTCRRPGPNGPPSAPACGVPPLSARRQHDVAAADGRGLVPDATGRCCWALLPPSNLGTNSSQARSSTGPAGAG